MRILLNLLAFASSFGVGSIAVWLAEHVEPELGVAFFCIAASAVLLLFRIEWLLSERR